MVEHSSPRIPIGLIINEFVFDWGSAATITFAAINVVGFVVLAFAFWVVRSKTKIQITGALQ